MSDGFTITIDARKLDALIAQLPQQLDNALAKASIEIVNEMKLSIHDSPATGRTYVRGGVEHTASSPGKPPRTDTGDLIGSLMATREGHLHHRVSTNAQHALWLEYGNSRGLQPRPFVRPVIEAWRINKLSQLIYEEIQGLL